MKLLRLIPVAVLLLAACSRGDDAAEQPGAEVTDKFASNHFLQYLNQQPSLAAGDYTVVAATAAAAQSGTFTLTIDGASQNGSWIGSSGQDPLGSGNPTFDYTRATAGGVTITLRSAVDAYLYLLDRNGNVLAEDDNSGGGSDARIFLPESRTNDASYAQAYYATIDPNDERATLDGFKAVNNFGAGDTHVIFRDTKDLGYGRDMYFHDNADGTYAFYVNNFVVDDVPGIGYGPLNLDAAIAQVKRYHIGTNAIEYGPIDIDGIAGGDDVNGDGTFDAADYFPRFYNYSATAPYERRDTVDLDGKGEKAMPAPCIVCHGGRADALLPDGSFPRSGDTFSHLQPLDVGTFEFHDASPWTRAEVEVGLKTINAAVYESYLPLETPPLGQWDSSMARELLEGWYGGTGLPGPFDDDYVPAGWQPDPSDGTPPAGADGLYTDVLSTNCRTCHLLRGIAHQSDIDFTSWEKFVGYASQVEELVYDEGLMPLATLTFDNFHESSFMAEVLASFLPDFSRYDDGGALLLPGRPIAKAGPDRRSPAPVAVSGTASLFADAYAWTIVSQPTGAVATLAGADTVRATLGNAIDGLYVLQLVVRSGSVASAPDMVSVVVDSAMSPTPAYLTFTDHIAPLLVSAGCTGCHTDGGNPRPPVVYTAGANRDVYATVRSLIDFDDPERSRLLLKPSGHHHAGGLVAGFDLDGSHDSYDLVLNWILEGAVKD